MNQFAELNSLEAFELLSKTVLKVEGAYAPSTIRAYKEDFLSFINFCNHLDTTPSLQAQARSAFSLKG